MMVWLSRDIRKDREVWSCWNPGSVGRDFQLDLGETHSRGR